MPRLCPFRWGICFGYLPVHRPEKTRWIVEDLDTSTAISVYQGLPLNIWIIDEINHTPDKRANRKLTHYLRSACRLAMQAPASFAFARQASGQLENSN